jgi:RNA polymerase sigma-32 factor
MANDDGFARYVQSLKGKGRLDHETERRLAERWVASRDLAAGRVIIETHLLFVVKIAHGFRRYGLALADLVAEGNIGLLLALERFDPSRNVRFISYAVWWIRALMLAHIQRHRSIVHGPREMSVRLDERDVSLDAPRSHDGAETRVVTLVREDESQEEGMLRADRERRVRATLDAIEPSLPPRERYILRHRLLSDEPARLRDIGRHFGVSRERVRQLELRVKRKLQHALAELAPERKAA